MGQAKRYIVLTIIAAALILQSCAREADTKISETGDGEQAKAAANEISPGVTAFESIAGTRFAGNLFDFSVRFEEVRAEIEEEKTNPFRNVPPDETGNVMIIMFHSFIEVYEEGDDKTVTTTLDDFRALLERLYADGYRTTSLTDFINGSIDVQRGCKPIIFTFDDGRATQFSLVENPDGTLADNPKTAVYVMERFYEEHPDFGLNGTFFLNLGFAGTFGKVGTLKERLEAMEAKGFELESHSYSHANFSLLRTPEEIMAELGENAKTLNEQLPDNTMTIFALPYGITNRELEQYIMKGTFEGFDYENKAIMLVGAEPAMPMYMKDAHPVKIRRILANGIEPVDYDFDWWYERRNREFISDGDPNCITIPADRLDAVDVEKVEALGRELIVIENAETE